MTSTFLGLVFLVLELGDQDSSHAKMENGCLHQGVEVKVGIFHL